MPKPPRQLLWHSLTTDSYPVVTSVSFLRDGTLATFNDDGSVRLWSTASGRVRRVVRLQNAPMCGTFASPMMFSPDGSFLASTECEARSVRVWRTQTGQNREFSAPSGAYVSTGAAGEYGDAKYLAFSPDNRLLAVAGSGGVLLYRLADGALLRRLPTRLPVSSLAFSPNGRLLAGTGGNFNKGTYYMKGGSDGEVKLWSVGTGKEHAKFAPFSLPMTAVAFAPDGGTLALAVHRGGASLWSVRNGLFLRALSAGVHTPSKGFHGRVAVGPIVPSVHAFAFSANGRFFAGASDRAVHLWNAKGKFLRSYTLLNAPQHMGTADVGALNFSRDGRKLAASNLRERAATIWELP